MDKYISIYEENYSFYRFSRKIAISETGYILLFRIMINKPRSINLKTEEDNIFKSSFIALLLAFDKGIHISFDFKKMLKWDKIYIYDFKIEKCNADLYCELIKNMKKYCSKEKTIITNLEKAQFNNIDINQFKYDLGNAYEISIKSPPNSPEISRFRRIAIY